MQGSRIYVIGITTFLQEQICYRHPSGSNLAQHYTTVYGTSHVLLILVRRFTVRNEGTPESVLESSQELRPT